MTRGDGVVSKIGREESWQLLRSTSFGRIGYRLRGRTRITPVNYVVDGSRIVFRTAEGSKFFALKIEDDVALQTDHYDEDHAWSVLVHGIAREITDEPGTADVVARLRPWVPTRKDHVFAIDVDKVRGRRFVLDRSPDWAI
ncbi:pyridoxamine 5'-phosphate oxidase family protein [Nostocoides sp. F2B08]|uniref:pyridoxamine 5'-phosphate oxidase family protein n=1 Tax=Nostocoides sp. F2B08 TaxID=2653936 RepID=UPI00126332D3|nr:pyridoxamine 5'-phosphate oxidase family protein [Tetrasphaera sp. F2B08]KAB7743640.1 pyridoxamine 5'-phosphate oxidase family protein [Tetrasphaera sp. F2B08]